MHVKRLRFTSAFLGLLLLSAAAAQQTTTRPAVGSDRHARIALPMDSGPVEVTYLAGSITPEDQCDRLRESAPNVRIVTGLSREDALRMAPDVHGIDGRYCTPEFLRAAKQLCWVQSLSAGVDRYLPGSRAARR